MQNQSPIIEVDELIKISENPNLRIFDVRTGPIAKEEYLKKHLNNSVFVDLNSDLAEIDNPKTEVDIRFRNLKILSRH
jgi:thiosulfate/3-mercaptopyruvate sulfurtransferase